MCCHNNLEFAKKLYHRIKNGKVIFPKIYYCNVEYGTFCLRSMWRQHKVSNYGFVCSDSTKNARISRETNDLIINQGIHVYLTQNVAKKCKADKEIIVKIRVKAEDLLGCDKETAVFTKVEIPKEEWEKVKKLNKEKGEKNENGY